MATPGTGFNFTPSTTTLTTTTAQGLSLTSTLSSSTTTSSAVPPTTTTTTDITSMSYKQLEETINQWTMEMEEQEKLFFSQAKQVNQWDRLLLSNADKISELSDAVERIKLDQQRLELELDFIDGQQRELNDVLLPLEKHVHTMSGNLATTSNPLNADVHRELTYNLAETVDSQLKRIAEDIKEIIEHLNTTSQSKMDTKEPVNQICQILNAHMDCLQSIEQNTGLIQQRLDEMTKQSQAIST